tara:strand:- start:146 stop:868 length:723 start_codon:yes stop_codon:yes gene_type:complete
MFNQKSRRLARLLIGLSSILMSYAVLADNNQPQYQIEMIIFSRLNSNTLAAEQWPTVNLKSFNLSLYQNQTYQDYLKLVNFNPLPAKNYFLDNMTNILQKSHYPILMHLAWTQVIGNARSAKPIHLYGGNAYTGNGVEPSFSNNENLQYDQYPQWQVNGGVKISVSRYFNLHFHLLFSEQRSTIAAIDNKNYFSEAHSPYIYFKLDQTRRTKSNELNYIDYPLYGILFEIKKIKATQATT